VSTFYVEHTEAIFFLSICWFDRIKGKYENAFIEIFIFNKFHHFVTFLVKTPVFIVIPASEEMVRK